MELINKETLREFGFPKRDIDNKELVEFIAGLLNDVKNFRNSREAGNVQINFELISCRKYDISIISTTIKYLNTLLGLSSKNQSVKKLFPHVVYMLLYISS